MPFFHLFYYCFKLLFFALVTAVSVKCGKAGCYSFEFFIFESFCRFIILGENAAEHYLGFAVGGYGACINSSDTYVNLAVLKANLFIGYLKPVAEKVSANVLIVRLRL